MTEDFNDLILLAGFIPGARPPTPAEKEAIDEAMRKSGMLPEKPSGDEFVQRVVRDMLSLEEQAAREKPKPEERARRKWGVASTRAEEQS